MKSGKMTIRRVALLVLLALLILPAVNGRYLLPVIAAVLILLLGTATGFAFFISRRRSGANGLFWTGLVSFDENDFGDDARFPDVFRTSKRSVGRQGLTGGRLRMKKSGVFWQAGSILTPGGQLHGSFIIPWPTIDHVDVSDIPNKSDSLGGAIRIYFARGEAHIYGEFLGSRKGLMQGLLNSPLGPKRQIR
jgi:hypothetical protein